MKLQHFQGSSLKPDRGAREAKGEVVLSAVLR